ncbi:MAG: biotin--[acetyl-CoA-carboxylase] ligase [Acidimicrobiia bacterium]
MDTPYALVSLQETTSTQDEARSRFAGSPVLVVAGRQTAGRGRSGSAWETAPTALAASIAFSTAWPADAWGRIPLVAGLSVLECLSDVLALKWPNDVMRGDEKVAGILLESFDGVVVAGLGVNLVWPHPPVGYGALYEEDSFSIDRLAIARCWASALLRRLNGGPDDWGADEYRRHCVTIGKEVDWEPSGHGLVREVADDGSLVVETERSLVRLVGGAVREVRVT